ncbi:protocatechuate 3,4-dioxygenase subunit alpha [Amycolatopsis pithecellobii]|uniref:Protocatechuate 3,4-dioxygenase subunit alpha n=1 Tax=Amycolatopsis pithecellobii TaxID=664692 RepID=A0A6N7Z0Z5_9PSEU|nr:protocatechuate 3,4-dioxygenase subunit alpha [Amycolatopsis pithecellobii]MTD53164.1 protocatechuate 3,4-dioxygenase subunit alpha [Amycolatopsis pithecellobii]
MSDVISPSQTIGPLYGFALMFDGSERTVSADAGDAIRISGSVFDGEGKAIPYPDTLVELWQGDQWARARADEDGIFRFVVRKPVAAPLPDGRAQAPHFTVAVFASGLIKQVVTRLYFPDERENSADPVLGLVPEAERHRLVARRTVDGLTFDIHLQGAEESVFFDY